MEEERDITNLDNSSFEMNKIEFAAISELVASANTSRTSDFSIDDLKTWINNPVLYSQKIRSVSDFYYNKNGIYKNIINTTANLPTLDYLILPSTKTSGKIQDKSYATYFDKVTSYVESINIKLLSRRILKSVARYGGYVGYQRVANGSYFVQTLPIDFCRIKYKVGNDYQIEFNFRYFDLFFIAEQRDLAWEMYPKEFKSLYNKYKKDSKSLNPQWQMLDIKNTICIQADDDDSVFVPMYSGMFESLIYGDEYRNLMEISNKLEITKLIVQKIPVDKDGKLAIPKDLAKVFHETLKKALPEGASALTTPLEVKDVPFANAGKEREDLLAKAERAIYVASGLSASLFADNNSHVGLTMNVENVTANIYSIMEKIEDVFSRKFLNVVNSRNYIFKLKFFRTTNINIKDTFDRMFQLASMGGAITPLFSLSGVDVESYITLLEVERQLQVKSLLEVPQSMHTQTSGGNDGGRPPKDEKELEESGIKTRDLGSNESK